MFYCKEVVPFHSPFLSLAFSLCGFFLTGEYPCLYNHYFVYIYVYVIQSIHINIHTPLYTSSMALSIFQSKLLSCCTAVCLSVPGATSRNLSIFFWKSRFTGPGADANIWDQKRAVSRNNGWFFLYWVATTASYMHKNRSTRSQQNDCR